MSAAELVIAKFGGQSALARLVGKRQSTIQHWAKSGRIPAQWQARLLEVAGQQGVVLSAADFIGATAHSHVVQFYEQDSYLIEEVARFVGAGLSSGNGAVVVATDVHRKLLAECMERHGFDLGEAANAGVYVARDAAETLSSFMVAGRPDRARFQATLKAIIEQVNRRATCKFPRAAVFGEMVQILWREGNRQGAIQLEELWNELEEVSDFSLLCAYSMDNFGRREYAMGFAAVCSKHSEVIPAESYSALPAGPERNRTIARLQQRARALETEVSEAEEQLALFRQAPGLGSFEIRLKTDTVALSPQARQLLGLPASSLAVAEFLKVFAGGDQKKLSSAIRRVFAEQKQFDLPCQLVTGSRPRSLRVFGKVLADPKERRILGVVQAVTLAVAR